MTVVDTLLLTALVFTTLSLIGQWQDNRQLRQINEALKTTVQQLQARLQTYLTD
jgi:hypothetical protein